MNLLQPKSWTLLERRQAQKFITYRVCALCGSDYRLVELPDGYQADCPNHGPAYSHQNVSRRWYESQQADQRIVANLIAAQDGPKMTEADYLKSLGF